MQESVENKRTSDDAGDDGDETVSPKSASPDTRLVYEEDYVYGIKQIKALLALVQLLHAAPASIVTPELVQDVSWHASQTLATSLAALDSITTHKID